LLPLFLIFPWCSLETVRGRAGGLRRGVSRMDAATELTGTYLQRPLRSPPARPYQESLSARHEGLRRWLR